ncbi:MAG: C1 family peptidase [Chitinophagales bacterium]
MKTYTLLLFLSICQLLRSQPIVDYRIYQSPVKTQAERGTCTAFGLVGAMETFPGFPTDLSEQYLYASAKSYSYNDEANYDEGTYLKNYIDLMQYEGTLREDQEPYNPYKVIIDSTKSNFENMKSDIAGTSLLDLLSFHDFTYKLQPEMYIYKEDADAKNVDYIKQKLDEGTKSIVVSYSINDHYWGSNNGSEDSKIDPNDFLVVDYKGEMYSYNDAIKLVGDNVMSAADGVYYTDTTLAINGGHAVCIVGYDNDGFLIKNSWDSDWGDDGYFWLTFEYHKLYAWEIMIPVLGKVYVDPAAAESNDFQPSQFKIKSLPHAYDSDALNMHTKSISISVVYYGDDKMPKMESIEYEAFDSNGNTLGTGYGNTKGIFDGRETGYETYILQQNGNTFPSAYKLVAKFTTAAGKTFTNTYYNIVAENKEYQPQ